MAKRVSLNCVNLIARSYFEGKAHAMYGDRSRGVSAAVFPDPPHLVLKWGYRKPDGTGLRGHHGGSILSRCAGGADAEGACSAADSSPLAFPEKDHANAGVQLFPRRIAGDGRQPQMPRKGQAGLVGKGNAMGPCQ